MTDKFSIWASKKRIIDDIANLLCEAYDIYFESNSNSDDFRATCNAINFCISLLNQAKI